VAAAALVPGNVAWGLAFGASAIAVGLRPGAAVTMSATVWSGTVQLAALPALNQALGVLFLSSLLLSLRFVPMSLALAGRLAGVTRWRRVLTALCLCDASFALVAAGRVSSPAAMFGCWVNMYASWLAGTAIGAEGAGALPGRLLAASDGLIAVIFAVLVVEASESRMQAAVAVVSAGCVALAMLGAMPGTVALPIAATLVSAAGLLMAHYSAR
jgi:predicted branched-subunit amino acid permease